MTLHMLQIPLVLTIGDRLVDECRAAGFKHVQDASLPHQVLNAQGQPRHEVALFETYVIVVPEGGENIRDSIAINLGDTRCRWAYVPDNIADLRNAILTARPMWTDEIATLDDIPDPGEIKTYKSGFHALDEHGFRFTLPAFMPIIGPYGSGKSVFLRQLLVNLWRLHGWKFLLTSFEERVKPRYQRDLRRHLIGKPVDSTASAVDRRGRSRTPTSKSASARCSCAASATPCSTWSACLTGSSTPCACTASRSSPSIRSTKSTTTCRRAKQDRLHGPLHHGAEAARRRLQPADDLLRAPAQGWRREASPGTAC